MSLNFLIGNGTFFRERNLCFYTDFETVTLSVLVLLVVNREILETFLLLIFLLAVGI